VYWIKGDAMKKNLLVVLATLTVLVCSPVPFVYAVPSSTSTTTSVASRFQDNHDGTITDTTTDIVWLKDGSVASTKTWYAAMAWCSTLASGTAGLTDGSAAGEWRLPGKDELSGLISGWSGDNPATWLDPQGFTNTQASTYWSSTTNTLTTSTAWDVFFDEGFEGYGTKTLQYYVRAVRSGQSGTFSHLVISKQGSGTVTSEDTILNCGSACKGAYSNGAYVQLTAAADAGSGFAGWEGGGCSGTGACNVTVSDNLTVTATFDIITTTTTSVTTTSSTTTSMVTTTSVAPATSTTTSIASRFQDNNDGTITDTTTDLIWLKDGAAAGIITWNEATAWCSGLASGKAGLTDGSTAGNWRMPSKNELLGLISGWTGESPAAWLDSQGFTNTVMIWPTVGVCYYYWSSTAHSEWPFLAWIVSFEDGQVYKNIKVSGGIDCVRPVRNTPCPATKALGQGSPQLDNLRDFRDSRLAQSALGRKVIQIYYDNAGSITAALDRSPALQAFTKNALEMIAPLLERKEE